MTLEARDSRHNRRDGYFRKSLTAIIRQRTDTPISQHSEMTNEHMTPGLNASSPTTQGGRGTAQTNYHVPLSNLFFYCSAQSKASQEEYTGTMQAKTTKPEQRHSETAAHWLKHPKKVP